jgi:hypothetical protein
MMKRISLILIVAAGLSSCASQQRTEPPAPVVGTGSGSGAATQAQPASPPPAPPEDTVEVYAYRPPSAAPDAVAPPGAIPAEAAGTPGGVGGAVPAESASSAPPGARPSGSAAPAPQVVAYAPPPPPAPSLPPAADALAKQAEQQRQAGDYVGAAATLERALRIQPQEAYLWNRLARIRMEQGLYSQAGNLASRSNALSKDQASLKRDNWSIIAASRRAAGDAAGAMEAEQKARGG